jgi:alkanesulfonate monooxygenase SsuD/methylene tetrahydromethanopterin reductase-like flavin-dependent oxidoreductase (luciferase family)
MDLGIGLPNTVPGATGKELTDWARAAEESGFSSLGTIDRIVFPNYEPVVALSAAAAVTERIKLVTDILLGPLRANPAMIAKQFLSLDALAGGDRAVLGIGLGGREDDYAISAIDMSGRGKWIDDALGRIRDIWNGDGELESKVGPRPAGKGPSLMVGGSVEAAFERAAKYGDGWTQGGSGASQFGADLSNLDDAWKKAGREGQPRTLALGYFSLGPDAEANVKSYVGNYYAWLGEDAVQGITAGAPKDSDSVQAFIKAYEEWNCDELILFPATSDPAQVGLLAEAAGL